MKASFMIAAPTSGSGKTTIARGLMALLTEWGFKVQPFKCGPDYIDTKFHETVCGRPSINLDTFMATPEHVRNLFARYSADADIAIIEGMMGLFDGYDRDKGSSAEIASVLDVPVVLVVDAKSAAYSIAPLLSGFVNFRKDVHIAGVIYNKVGSERHFQMLKQVCDDLGITCFGYLPKEKTLEQDSRYLGLDFSVPTGSQELIKTLEERVEWKRLLTLNENTARCPREYGSSTMRIRLVVARNQESFSFLYQENLDRYEHITFFDPEKDVPDLSAADLLYLPGGYPEKHLDALVTNEACRKAIKEYAEKGGKIVAECGGMMYLCEKIVTDDGEYPMCGVLSYTITARRADRKLSLGYRRFELNGKEFRGHEFHYTQFHRDKEKVERGEKIATAVQVYNAKGDPVDTPVIRYKNVLASYTHLYKIGDVL